MSKVYIVYEFFNNREPYEDNSTVTTVLKVFDSKVKALTFIEYYCPKDYMTEQEANASAKEKWEKVKKYPSAEDYYKNYRGYMHNTYRYVESVEHKRDGSKTIFCHNGPCCTKPSFRIYFEAREVE